MADAPARRGSYLQLDEGWSRVAAGGPGPFVTHERLRAPDGREVVWRSRPHRKGRDLITMRLRRRTRRSEMALWSPHRLGWWIGVLFMIGATCFAGASLPDSDAELGIGGVSGVYFVGSLFFTSAAYLQLLQTVNVERRPEPGSDRTRALRALTVEPRRIDWWSSAVQLLGTLMFNVSTLDGTIRGLSPRAEDLSVWVPNVIGSACFLIASGLAVAEIGARPRLHDPAWWVTEVNLAGSVAFGVAAGAAYVVPGSGLAVSASGAALWTLIGAVCFLVGAYLLLPEAEHAERVSVAMPTDDRVAAGLGVG